jgi:DNA-binding beta-propeller fold protein YncE
MVRSSRRVLVLAAAAVVAAGVSVGLWEATRHPERSAPGPAVALPPSPVVGRIPLAGKPRQLVRDGQELWVITERHLHRIDTSTNQVVASVPVGTNTADPRGLGLSSDAVWVPGRRSDLMWRVDRDTNRISGRIHLGQVLYGPIGVATRKEVIWVSCCAFQHGARPKGMLLRVDSRRNQVTARIPVPEGPLAVAADQQAVWVGTAHGSLLRVDPASSKVARVPPPSAASRIQALSPGSGVLWVADTGAGAIRRLDPGSGRYDLAVAAPVPRKLAAGPDGVWVVTDLHLLLSRVDIQTGRRGRPIPLRHLGGVRGVVAGPDGVWVTTGNQLVRIDPTRLSR